MTHDSKEYSIFDKASFESKTFIPGFIIFQFQKDENGYVDFNKLIEENEDSEKAMQVLKMFDRNDDGKISKEEFIRLYSKSRGSSYNPSLLSSPNRFMECNLIWSWWHLEMQSNLVLPDTEFLTVG